MYHSKTHNTTEKPPKDGGVLYKKRTIGVLDFSQFSNEEIMEHFNHRCQICGSTYEVALHHLIFKSSGGHNNPRLPLCGKCHRRLHGEGGFREKHESRLFDIAEIFWGLKMSEITSINERE